MNQEQQEYRNQCRDALPRHSHYASHEVVTGLSDEELRDLEKTSEEVFGGNSRSTEEPEHDCPDSPDGKHSFTADIEYDSSGLVCNCEYCGEPEPTE